MPRLRIVKTLTHGAGRAVAPCSTGLAPAAFIPRLYAWRRCQRCQGFGVTGLAVCRCVWRECARAALDLEKQAAAFSPGATDEVGLLDWLVDMQSVPKIARAWVVKDPRLFGQAVVMRGLFPLHLYLGR